MFNLNDSASVPPASRFWLKLYYLKHNGTPATKWFTLTESCWTEQNKNCLLQSSSDPLFPFCRITARLCTSHRRLTFCSEPIFIKWDSWWADVCTVVQYVIYIRRLKFFPTHPKNWISHIFSKIVGDKKFHLFGPVKGRRLVSFELCHFRIFLRIKSYWDFLFLRLCSISF